MIRLRDVLHNWRDDMCVIHCDHNIAERGGEKCLEHWLNADAMELLENYIQGYIWDVYIEPSFSKEPE